ncbi:MAG: nucleotidyltransferase [Sedimentibacter sp.]
MNITGIVAEYNPFHMGHEYQLKKARELSRCDSIAVVMSGNYVQRGEPAIIDKFKRAEAAIYGGADLVVELPLPFSCQNAEMFANAAVKELKKLSVNSLSFGCETDDINLLKEVAELQLCIKFQEEIKQEIKMGISYPNALANVISKSLGEEAFNAASSPNNVLAIEYIKSTMKQNVNWNLFPVKRMGKDHNDLFSDGYYDSATAIRKKIINSSIKNISVPEKSKLMINQFYQEQQSFNSFNNYLDILHYKIIQLGPEGLKQIYEVAEGLNNKIYSNVFKHESIDDFIMALKSKRYTYSKLRRMLLNILLGITYNDIKHFMLTDECDYIKILAFNDIGRNIIRQAKNNKIAVVNRFSDYKRYSMNAEELPLFKLTAKATNIYYIPLKNKKFNEEYISNAVYVKS